MNPFPQQPKWFIKGSNHALMSATTCCVLQTIQISGTWSLANHSFIFHRSTGLWQQASLWPSADRCFDEKFAQVVKTQSSSLGWKLWCWRHDPTRNCTVCLSGAVWTSSWQHWCSSRYTAAHRRISQTRACQRLRPVAVYRLSGAITGVIPWSRTRLVDRSFDVAGPRLWNKLPASLRSSDSICQFYLLTYVGDRQSNNGIVAVKLANDNYKTK